MPGIYHKIGIYLPRRQESLSNQDGRIGVLALTLSGIKASDGLSPDTFELDVPDGYSTAAYQAVEKKSEGVPCKQAMPVLQRLHEKYSTQGVTVIGVHCFAAKGGKPPMDYIRLKKYTYRQITAGDEIAKAYSVASLPTLYVIDQSGEIAFHHIGFKQDLESDLTRIIAALIED